MSRPRLRSCFTICLLFLFFASQAAAGQDQQTDISVQPAEVKQQTYEIEPVHLDMDYFKGYFTDTASILTSPWRWDSTDWLKAGIITGISVGLFIEDDQINNWVQGHKNHTSGDYADSAKKIGTWSIPALAGLGAFGYIAPNEKAKTTFLLSIESFLVTGVFVQVLKHATGRARPNTGHNHDYWSGPTLSSNNDNLSFPSGDSSSVFSVASVVASEYDNWFVPPLVYAGSTAIGLERIHNNAHWSSDIFVGGVIGYFTGKAIVANHRSGKENRLSLTTIMDGSAKGLMVTYRY